MTVAAKVNVKPSYQNFLFGKTPSVTTKVSIATQTSCATVVYGQEHLINASLLSCNHINCFGDVNLELSTISSKRHVFRVKKYKCK